MFFSTKKMEDCLVWLLDRDIAVESILMFVEKHTGIHIHWHKMHTYGYINLPCMTKCRCGHEIYEA